MKTRPDKCPPGFSLAAREEWERERVVREAVIAEIRKISDEDLDWHALFDEADAAIRAENQMRNSNWRSDLADATLLLRMRTLGKTPSPLAELRAREACARLRVRLKAICGLKSATHNDHST